jgi:hypothetical protein
VERKGGIQVKMILRLIFILMTSILICRPTVAQTLFEDDFERANRSEVKWMLFNGDWEFANGALRQDNAEGRTIAIVSDGYWNEEWVDYTFEVTATKLSGTHGVQIYWRIQDDFKAVVGRDDERSFTLDPTPEGRLATIGTRRLKAWWEIGRDGKSSIVIRDVRHITSEKKDTESAHFMEPDVPIRIKIVNSATRYQLYINDEMVSDAGDISIKGGRIGLGTEDTSAEFDDVVVYGPDGLFAVEPVNRLTTTWGQLKSQ